MNVALIQFNSRWEAKRENLERAEEFVQRAAEDHCDVVIFPEMFATGFSMNIPAVADEGYGETAIALSHMAKKYSINLIAGYAMVGPGGGKARNMAVVFNRKGQPNVTYTKIHPFSFAGEDKHFIAGTATSTFTIDDLPCSVFICYDLRFPEVFRSVAKEVQAIFVIANWPTSRKAHWEALLKARAIENQCFIIGVNRIGTDGNGIHYPGASHIFDPLGNDLCSGNDTDEYITGALDPAEVERVRSAFPFLNDMKHCILEFDNGENHIS
ncbi:MAG: carbon-nitrogen family hydrolase [Nitrospirota bacterium]